MLITAGAARAGERVLPQITSADAASSNLFINGRNFGVAAPPVVTLGDVALTVQSFSPTAIVASLPLSVQPASYQLLVQSFFADDDGKGSSELDRRLALFSVTIGVVGPQGPAGPTGPQGPAGVFTGHFQSANGAYSLDIDDTGIRLAGPGASLQVVGSAVHVTGDAATVSATSIAMQSAGVAQVSASVIVLEGELLNGGLPVARVGDRVQVGNLVGTIVGP